MATGNVATFLYAIKPPALSWMNDNIAVSRLSDDACDGSVEVRINGGKARPKPGSARTSQPFRFHLPADSG